MRRPVQAVILAGGRGKRLGRLTDTIPKPMLEVNGKPFLQHLIELLKEQGFQKVLLLLGYLPDVIRDHFKDGAALGISIEYSVSPEEDDTGTRVRLAKERLDPSFLLMYCDNYWPLPMDRVWERFVASGAKAQVTVYNNRDGWRKKHNAQVGPDGMVVRYDKKEDAPQELLQGVEIGFALMRKEVVDLIPERNVNFEEAVYPALIRDGQLSAYTTDQRYYGVGHPDKLPLIEAFLRPTIILDRDGVLNEKAAPARYVTSPESFKWLPGSKEAVRMLKHAGYRVVLATNQAGIARGAMSEEDLHRIHERMQQDLGGIGAKIDAIYYCKHGWDDGCQCRKPNPGMLLQAQRELHIDLSRTYFIGDDPKDREAGERAGCKTLLVDADHSLLRLVEEKILRVRPKSRADSFSDPDSLYEAVRSRLQNAEKPTLVLIGGCSRSGKSRLAQELSRRFDQDNIANCTASLDSWLVSLENRGPRSTVLERYECQHIVKSINSLLSGEPVHPPVYDPIARRRVAQNGQLIPPPQGVLLAEGVVALAIPELVDRAAIKIFVDASDETRTKRLTDFYYKTKALPLEEAQKTIESRDCEEVPFIKKTAEQADIIFRQEVVEVSR